MSDDEIRALARWLAERARHPILLTMPGAFMAGLQWAVDNGWMTERDKQQLLLYVKEPH